VIRALLLLLLTGTAAAAAAPASSDWPCAQRLVPVLSAATYWPGPLPDSAGAWRDDSGVVAAVEAASPRSVAEADGTQSLRRFLEAVPRDKRQGAAELLFAGLLEEANRERAAVIARIEEIARRQREVAAIIARVEGELNALPSDADQAKRDEVVQRRAMLIRQFEATRRTTRYQCEVPVAIEARLGAYARALQAEAGQ